MFDKPKSPFRETQVPVRMIITSVYLCNLRGFQYGGQ
jgi:hypothetical protein